MEQVSQAVVFASFFLFIVAFVFINNIFFLKGISFPKRILKSFLLMIISPLLLMFLQLFVSEGVMGVVNGFIPMETNSLEYKILLTFIEICAIILFLFLFTHIYSKVIHANLNLCRFIYYLFLIVILCVDTLSFTPLSVVISSVFMLGCNYYMFKKNLHIFKENVDANAIRTINILPVAVLFLQFILITLWNILPESLVGKAEVSPVGVVIACFSIGLYTFLCVSYRIAFDNYEQRIELKKDSEERLKTQEEIILAFAEIVEAKSSQTGQHVKRVSEYSYVLAKGMGIDEEEAQKIRVAAMMHDIGKLFIPPEILEKPGKLTPEEFDVIKSHVTFGENILHNAPGDIMEYAKKIALDHHEKWNGKGYLSKKGEEISLVGRIVAVADVFDALVSKRSYKNAWSEKDAKEQIVTDRGSHFDPKVVDVFLKNYDSILNVLNSFPDGEEKVA